MSIPKHSLLSGEPRDFSIDIQTDKVVNTGVMFCLGLLEPKKCSGMDINSMHQWGSLMHFFHNLIKNSYMTDQIKSPGQTGKKMK
jgi:hypothetical protein